MSTKRRSWAIVGTGALGGYYGARLAHAGCDVHLLAHSDYEHIREHGLLVQSKHGDFSIDRPNVYRDTGDMPACDVVMIALKSTHNRLLGELLPPLVHEGVTVVLAQNGLGEEEKVAAIAGEGAGVAVLGALAFLCSNKIGPGHVRHLDYGEIRLGQHTGDGSAAGVTDAMRAVAADFEPTHVPIVLEDDLRLARWKKLVWNVPYNGLCVAMNTTTDRIMGDAHTRALAAALMGEVKQGAAACGRRVDDAFVRDMLERTDRMVPYAPSMKLDYDAGRPLEIDAIYANPLEAAAARGVGLPRIETLYRQLAFMDAHNPNRRA